LIKTDLAIEPQIKHAIISAGLAPEFPSSQQVNAALR
jgi:hypothetical protein